MRKKINWQALKEEVDRHYDIIDLDKELIVRPEHLRELRRREKLVRHNETLQVIRVRDTKLTGGNNLHLLGLAPGQGLDRQQLLSYYHPGQRKVVLQLIHRVFLMLFHYRGYPIDIHYYFSQLRAYRHVSGELYYTYYQINPWQISKSGIVLSYTGRVQWLKPYSGEPLHFKFGYSGLPDQKTNQVIEFLNSDLRQALRQSIIGAYAMREQRVRVAELLAQGMGRMDIARAIGRKDVSDHCDAIKNAVRQDYPELKIKGGYEAAKYLIRMGM